MVVSIYEMYFLYGESLATNTYLGYTASCFSESLIGYNSVLCHLFYSLRLNATKYATFPLSVKKSVSEG